MMIETCIDSLVSYAMNQGLALLEDAGVYKCTAQGRQAFLRFVDAVNG